METAPADLDQLELLGVETLLMGRRCSTGSGGPGGGGDTPSSASADSQLLPAVQTAAADSTTGDSMEEAGDAGGASGGASGSGAADSDREQAARATVWGGVAAQRVVTVRRRSGMRNEPKTITLRSLQAVFDKPIQAAAAELGIGKTLLKKLCREKFGIERWPYRKRGSVQKLIGKVEAATQGGGDPDTLNLLDELTAYYDSIIHHPNLELGPAIKKLRQIGYKADFTARQQADE